MIGNSNSHQHFHDVLEISVQADFIVDRCIKMFNIISFLFHLSHSLRWKTRKCLLSFFFLSLLAGRPEPETKQRSGGHAD